jgi:hypothetical protein
MSARGFGGHGVPFGGSGTVSPLRIGGRWCDANVLDGDRREEPVMSENQEAAWTVQEVLRQAGGSSFDPMLELGNQISLVLAGATPVLALVAAPFDEGPAPVYSGPVAVYTKDVVAFASLKKYPSSEFYPGDTRTSAEVSVRILPRSALKSIVHDGTHRFGGGLGRLARGNVTLEYEGRLAPLVVPVSQVEACIAELVHDLTR